MKTQQFRIESLEDRKMMAGDVSVALDNGTLELNGDHASNAVEIRQLDSDSFEVIGLKGATDTTTVNGTSRLLFHGVTDIDADFNGGNDRFTILGDFKSPLSRDVDIDMDGGNDTVSIHGLEMGSLDIETDDGTDYVQLHGITVGKKTTIDTGRDDDTVDLFFSNFGNDVTIDTDSGNDDVFATVVDVVDDMTINTGSGRDEVYFQNVDMIQASASNRSNLRVNLGSGNDYARIRDVDADRMIIDGGWGFDTLDADDVDANVYAPSNFEWLR